MKRVITIFGIGISLVLLSFIIFLIYATIREYRPDLEEKTVISLGKERSVKLEDSLGLLVWNIGYSGLGAEQDFVLDGGNSDQATLEETTRYRENIINTLVQYGSISDFILLQEVDRDSKRSFYQDFYAILQERIPSYHSTYATNYRAPFVPFPVGSPIGKVESGIATFSKFPITEATRIALPSKNRWPVKSFHLKRNLLVTRIHLEEKELVLINGHFSAYGPELLPEQLRIAKELITEEYTKGNYVILGADWNQIPPVPGANDYPLEEEPLYIPEEIPKDWTPDGWTWGMDPQVPTYRLLNQPYNPNTFQQVGIIDGFLVSPNLEIVELYGVDLQFKDSDHNPVYMRVSPKE